MSQSVRDQILAFIVDYSQRRGYAPTVREVMAHAGLSSSSAAHYHLRYLKDTGVITWVAGRARTIRIVQ